MSSSNNNHSKAKGVRFAEGDDSNERPSKRPRAGDRPPSIRKKKKKDDRPNEDEMDDVDDWENDEDEDPSDLPSEKERLQAKRARREQREGSANVGDNDDDDDNEEEVINQETSLATEGVPIEPFHMDNEKSDGTGYFDGDTYVFRNRGEEEEPDAWLESLKDTTTAASATAGNEQSSDSEQETAGSSKIPEKSKEEWYAIILPLLSSNNQETIMQAVARYGKLIKRQPLKKRTKGKKQKEKEAPPTEAFTMAQQSLNQLTEAANALLGMGDVDVYQKTKSDLLKLVPQKAVPPPASSSNNSTIMWEYQGKQDDQIHGPYSSEHMKAWIQAGYFVGDQAVQIRSVKKAEKSTADDLLADLMDDDDEEEEKATETETEYVRGEWQLSDKVDYDAA